MGKMEKGEKGKEYPTSEHAKNAEEGLLRELKAICENSLCDLCVLCG